MLFPIQTKEKSACSYCTQTADSLVKIGKWSDGEQWVTDRDGASEESEEVITR